MGIHGRLAPADAAHPTTAPIDKRDQAKTRAMWKRRGITFTGPRPDCSDCGAPGRGLWSADADDGTRRKHHWCWCDDCEENGKHEAAANRKHAGLT